MFASNMKFLASAGSDKKLIIYNFEENFEVSFIYDLFDSYVNTFDISLDCYYLATGCEDGVV